MITFNNVSLLSYQRNNKYLGENNYYFATEKNISVRGYLYDFSCTSGIGTGILTGFNAINTVSDSYLDNIVINGASIGSGYVTNISVENGNWIRLANFTASILILETGDLYNMVGEFYPQPTGISDTEWKTNYLNPITKYIDDISIYTEISKSYENRSYEIKDGCQISLNPAFVASGEIYAKSIYNLFARPYSQIVKEVAPYSLSSGNFRVYESRNIDNINKKYTFDRLFVELIGNPSGLNFFEFSVSSDDAGKISASEKSRHPKYNESIFLSGFKNAFSIYPTLLDIDKNNGPTGLNSFLLRYGISGAVMYESEKSYSETDEYYEREVSYSNDGGPVISGYSFKISKNITKDENGSVTCTINLSIDGDGEPGKAIKWNNALSGFYQRKENTHSSALNGVLDNVGYVGSISLCGTPNPPFLDSYSITTSKYEGTIEYSVKATNKKMKETGSANGILYVEDEFVRDDPPRTEYKEYNIFNGSDFGGSLIQVPYPQTSLGQKTITKTRKYMSELPLSSLEFPDFGTLPEFTISKKTKKSNGVAEIEYVYNYH